MGPQASALEIGCGTGTTAIRLAPHAGSILASDPSGALIDISQRRAEEAAVSNLRFAQAPAEALIDGGSLHSEGPFDAVIAFNVLHLLKDPEAVIHGAAAALKPGGVLVANTFCAGGWLKMFWPVARGGAAIGKLPHIAFFSEDRFKGWLADAGFVLTERWTPATGRVKLIFTIARKS